ncbi:MAG TPA: exodeoxyribonuclease VII small subunit [Candidatus Melainabacteria bacterium]|jgi:exodeoxyribonuclease VII small subunit|nr:exodeoxyribonuclease VII small subunit [Candidatus Melainabacteria bacterium]HIN65466.1 exodeoxyribonuclease VII small subunit [Candidatus Obscuribacterales bacterium]
MAKTIDFESSLKELEQVVGELDGEIKLERALSLFERGMELSTQLESFLKVAEQKVEILRKQADGSHVAEAFDDKNLDSSAD